MSSSIRIEVSALSLTAELNDSPTAKAILDALPIEAAGNCWGEEIYFKIPVDHELESTARSQMKIGELAYWPPGSAFCIFLGRTPASSGDAPRAASDVTPIGHVLGDIAPLKGVPDGAVVCLKRAD